MIKPENYRSTFKATTIFAGVQVFLILIGIAKSKIIALWLGPYGFGLLSVFNSVIAMLYSISNLGLASSGVKEVASVINSYEERTNLIISLKRWSLGTGVIGAIITICLSPLLSKFTFGTLSYTLSFIFLSIVVLLNGISYVNLAIIQGSQNLRSLAITNILGALIGFTISVPLYYYLGIKGIVPSIILTGLSLFLITQYNLKKLRLTIANVHQDYTTSWKLGLGSVKLGILISVSFIAVTVAEFVIKTFIIKVSNLNLVGLYQAGWTLNTTYLGMVFTAMATDFYPRLSLDAFDNNQVKIKVNQQAEIAMLILGPMIVIMIICLPILIKILYSTDFLNIIEMTRLLLLGSLLKAGSWAISFIFLAKGNGKQYLFNELGVKLLTLPIYLLLFYYYHLLGIGIAFIIDQILYFIWVSVTAWTKYKFRYSKEFFKIFTVLALISIISLISVSFNSNIVSLALSILSIGSILAYSLFQLNLKLDIITYTKSRFCNK